MPESGLRRTPCMRHAWHAQSQGTGGASEVWRPTVPGRGAGSAGAAWCTASSQPLPRRALPGGIWPATHDARRHGKSEGNPELGCRGNSGRSVERLRSGTEASLKIFFLAQGRAFHAASYSPPGSRPYWPHRARMERAHPQPCRGPVRRCTGVGLFRSAAANLQLHRAPSQPARTSPAYLAVSSCRVLKRTPPLAPSAQGAAAGCPKRQYKYPILPMRQQHQHNQ